MPPKDRRAASGVRKQSRVPRLLRRRKAAAKVIVTLTKLKIGMTSRTATVFLL